MDKFKIDSHKLMYHVDRVAAWHAGQNVYPIYVEISPCGTCNHRCTFCALDYMAYQKRYLTTGLLNDRLAEMGRIGIKSAMFAGEGEPFLHKDMVQIAESTNAAGIDVAFTTNGVLLRNAIVDKILDVTEWIKVSINAGKQSTYARIHRTGEGDFEKVIDNMKYAAKVRADRKLACVLGLQMLLLPENYKEATVLAKIARDIGMDYLVIKPYSQHLMSTSTHYGSIDYSLFIDLSEELQAYNTQTFNVIFRANAMRKSNYRSRNYSKCLALPFWAYIDAGGNVWGCSAYLGDERFLYGNIYQSSFQEIWLGEQRKASLEYVATELDPQTCRVNCRMDEINQYLWDLKHPAAHVNFI